MKTNSKWFSASFYLGGKYTFTPIFAKNKTQAKKAISDIGGKSVRVDIMTTREMLSYNIQA